MESKDTILVISEGVKPEKIIYNSIKEHFFNKKNQKSDYEFISYNSHLYSLYSKLKEDDFLTDIIELIIEIDPAQEEKLINARISQVFLFFDFDGHTIQDEVIRHDQVIELLEHFNNETENGLLYLSYPMAEALKDYQKDYKCYNYCSSKIDIGKEFKTIINNRSDFKYPKSYTLDHWYFIIYSSISKGNCLFFDSYNIPDYEVYINEFNSETIYDRQYNKFISTESKVAILSAYPFFILDYFGKKLYDKIKSVDSI